MNCSPAGLRIGSLSARCLRQPVVTWPNRGNLSRKQACGNDIPLSPPTRERYNSARMNAPKERIFVTGAAGFIGSHLTERLLALGHQVIGIDNFDPFYPAALKRQNLAAALAHPSFQLIEGDCAEAADVERAFDGGIDAVVHLAARAGVRPSIQDPLGYTRANIVATQVMLEAARKHAVNRFIFGSSSSVYGNNAKVPFSETDPVDHPISPYAATKRACELICHTYHHLFGMTVLSLRFFTVYGPRQRPDLAIRKFATLMSCGEVVPFYGDGSSERDYTWIDDIMQGVLGAIARSRAPAPATTTHTPFDGA